MTKMAATPIYGKNPASILFSGTGGPISTKRDIYHWGLQPIIVCSNDDASSDLDLFYCKIKFGNLGFSMGKNENRGFSETIAASDLNGSRSRQLIEYMNIFEY